jgi:RHS repeat-associated protein
MGRPAKMVSAGSTWTFTTNLLGQRTSQQTPDNGAASWTYDNAGEVSSTTDARGQTLAYKYDALGRKTAEYSGSTSGPLLASWLYDTLQPGKLTSETRYTSSGRYVTGTTGYDGQGNPQDQLTVVPAGEAGLSGKYDTGFGYSSTGLLLTTTPAPISGMPGEIITTSYDSLGNAYGVAGTSVTASRSLSGYGQPSVVVYGGSTNNAKLTYTYDVQTLNPTDVNLSAQVATPQLDDTTYTYSPAGQVTSVKDTQGPNGSPVDDQCFGYDALGRLNQAWTSAPADCSQNPATAGNTAIGGPNPYWSTWSFDDAGDRKSQTSYAVTGGPAQGATTTYTYNAGGHTLAGTTGGPGGPTSYGYDAAGNTTARNLPSGAQTLTWNEEGKAATATTPAGTTTWIDNADGNEVVRRDPGSTTLDLPGQEVSYNSSTGTVSTRRYYSLGGSLIAVSDGSTAGTQYLIGDQHGTQQLAVDTTTLALTRRSTDPYGNQRGTVSGGAWPDNHGFLNMPVSPGTALIDVGAREYDPTIGRFISVDPKLNMTDPQSATGYSYADNAPTSGSDPSGQMRVEDAGGSAPAGGGSGGCGCDDWWNDATQNSAVLPTPTGGAADNWWDDPGQNKPVGGPSKPSTPHYVLIGSRGSGDPLGFSTPDGIFDDDVKKQLADAGLAGLVTDEYNPYPAVSIGDPRVPLGAWLHDGGKYDQSVAKGEALLRSMIGDVEREDPTAKIILVGYSQGAEVTANVYQSLADIDRSHVFGMVLFGDTHFNGRSGGGRGGYSPKRNGAFGQRPAYSPAESGRIMSYCNAFDGACQAGDRNYSGSGPGFWAPNILIDPTFGQHTHYAGPAEDAANSMTDWILRDQG